jgi:hypothetical protein
MRNNLVAVQREVDPLFRRAPLLAAEQIAVECARCAQRMHGEGMVEGRAWGWRGTAFVLSRRRSGGQVADGPGEDGGRHGSGGLTSSEARSCADECEKHRWVRPTMEDWLDFVG